MRSVAGYVYSYFSLLNKRLLAAVMLALAVLIFLNYHYDIASTVDHLSFPLKFLLYGLLFTVVFAASWFGSLRVNRDEAVAQPAAFYVLLLAAPLIFAIKISLPVSQLLSTLPVEKGLRGFLQVVLQWPVKAVPVVLSVILLWKRLVKEQPVAGLAAFSADRVKPYLLMLLLVMPLIVIAAQFPDFQAAYPKLCLVASPGGNFLFGRSLLFELLYGSDFFTIEFFFRGFLVLAFARFAGKAAILPMAAFYCTIHFGKPLGECISSFFGGMILGAVVYNTRSIWGGLIVHLGIAWAMELAGMLL